MSDQEGDRHTVPPTGNTFVFQAGSNPTFYVGDADNLEQLMKEYLIPTHRYVARVDKSDDNHGTGSSSNGQ